MRDFKFRAWNGKNIISDNELRLNSLYALDKELDIKEFVLLPLRYEIMQYTGLKDKNGVEIYEGDILRVIFNDDYSDVNMTIDDETEYIAKVKFYYGGWFLEVENKDNLYMYDICEVALLEIIGNIYENKKLLEEL